jgi:hypothetical protein
LAVIFGSASSCSKSSEPKPVFRDYVDRCLARPALKRAMAIDAAGV